MERYIPEYSRSGRKIKKKLPFEDKTNIVETPKKTHRKQQPKAKGMREENAHIEAVLNDINRRECRVVLKDISQRECRVVLERMPISKLNNNRKVLRKRHNKKNYLEKSLEGSQDRSFFEKPKGPVYNQIIPTKQNKKKKRDVYELDVSGDENINKRKKKRGKIRSGEMSLPFERYMKEVMSELDRKEAAKIRKNKRLRKKVVISKKINIISNIQIQSTPRAKVPEPDEHTHDTDFDTRSSSDGNRTPHFGNLSPIGNKREDSSPTKDDLNADHSSNKEVSLPWRLDLGIRKNPHFLQFKQSRLPNYNQEMVLDSTFDKRTNTSSIPIEPVKKQTSILKYVNTDKENSESFIMECSLFDQHEISISPKKKSVNVRNNKENVSPNKSVEKNKTVNSPKKRTFGTELSSNTGDFDSDFFGFDNSKPQTPKAQKRFAKPFRFNPIVKLKTMVDLRQETKETNNENNRIDESVDLEEFGMFGDFVSVERKADSNLKQYTCHRPKRKRCQSPVNTETESEEDVDENEKQAKKKKKKSARTRVEEAAAERWYAKFNKMCEEVENFPLEIE